MESDRLHMVRGSDVKSYYLVLLNCQHCTVTAQNCNTPVFINDILTNGTQSWGLKSEKKKVFRFARMREVAV